MGETTEKGSHIFIIYYEVLAVSFLWSGLLFLSIPIDAEFYWSCTCLNVAGNTGPLNSFDEHLQGFHC